MFSWLDIIIVGWVTNNDFDDVDDLDGKTLIFSCGCKGRIRRHADKASTGRNLIIKYDVSGWLFVIVIAGLVEVALHLPGGQHVLNRRLQLRSRYMEYIPSYI